jgi:hypothetical protein
MAKRRQRNPFLFYTSPRREKRERYFAGRERRGEGSMQTQSRRGIDLVFGWKRRRAQLS